MSTFFLTTIRLSPHTFNKDTRRLRRQSLATIWSCINPTLEALLPAHCVICRLAVGGPHWLCDSCTHSIQFNLAPCHYCAMPNHPLGLCTQCCQRHPITSQAHARLLYDGIIKELIQRWKFNGATELTPWLVNIGYEGGAGNTATLTRVDQIVPVPMHWLKQLNRGHNQAELLARALAKRIYEIEGNRIPVCKSLSARASRPNQHQLNRTLRRHNARGRYRAVGNLKNQRILLVDDVLTTGATAHAAASTLLEAGAQDVQLWCLARSP